MDWNERIEKLRPKLKRLSAIYGSRCYSSGEEDLYQEACVYLYEKYKDGIPPNINESYLLRGCQFHILNFVRKNRDKGRLTGLDTPLDEGGNSLKDLLPDRRQDPSREAERKIIVKTISENAFSPTEKKIFACLSEGFTLREAARETGLSHVMVLKRRRSLVNKWQKKIRLPV